jgi:23S rRNA-/tRNA-specific pseudouridylate synthase
VRTVALTVPSPADPPRLDRFLAANLHGVSRKRVKGIIDAGQVRVGRRIERRAGRALHPGDTVEIDWRPSMLGDIPTLRPADVVATGAGWWAITKPPGLLSHRTEEDGIAAPEQLAAVIGQASQPVHRLDRETSGVLVLAVGDAVARLSMRFADRAVSKTYRAIVYPAPDLPGEITDTDADMHASVRILRRSKDGSRGDVGF